MEEYETPASQSTSVVRFLVIGIILVMFLLVGLYFGKQAVVSMQAPSQQAKTPQAEPAKKGDTSKRVDTKQQQEKKPDQSPAEPKKQEPAPQSGSQGQGTTPAPSTPTPTTPNQSTPPQPAAPAPQAANPNGNIASTGPEETLFVVIAVAALGYGSASFVRSRTQLLKTIRQATKA